MLNRLARVDSPYVYKEWDRLLRQHPDQPLVKQFLHSIRHGADIRYRGPLHAHREFPTTMHDATCRDVLEGEIVRQIQQGWLVGPLERHHIPFENYIVSPMFGIPRQEGKKWRLIHDLTHGPEPTVNANVDPTEFLLRYPRIDDVVQTIQRLRQGRPNRPIWLYKSDIASAFMHIVVRLEDRRWLLFQYQDKYFIRLTVSMGCRSSPGLFEIPVALFKWILKAQYPVLHRDTTSFVDDFCGVVPDSLTTTRETV